MNRKEVIHFLTTQQENRHPAFDIRSPVGSTIFTFLTNIYNGICQQQLPSAVTSIPPEQIGRLSRYGYDLMTFRASLVDNGLAQQKPGYHYLNYTRATNYYSECLDAGNPFLLRWHWNELYTLITNAQETGLTEQQRIQLDAAVLRFMEAQVQALDPEPYRGFKALMYARGLLLTAAFLRLQQPALMAEADNPVVTLCDSAIQRAGELEEMQGDYPEDWSLALYEDANLPPMLMDIKALATELKHAPPSNPTQTQELTKK